MLDTGSLLAVLDSVAAGVTVFEAAMGVLGSEAGTISKAAGDNLTVLTSINDSTVQRDLASAFAARASLVLAGSMYGGLQGAGIQRALDRHYGGSGIGNLNRYLESVGARVHPNLRKIGMQIDSRNAFAPVVVDPVASYEGTGAGTGTFAAGSDIDASLYYAAPLQVVVDVMGASTRTLRLTLKQFDQTTVTRDVVVPANSIGGFAIAVGAGGEKFSGVTAIVTTGGGGTATDRLHVRSQVERAIVL